MKTTAEIRRLMKVAYTDQSEHERRYASEEVLCNVPALLDALDEERHRSDAYKHRYYKTERRLNELRASLVEAAVQIEIMKTSKDYASPLGEGMDDHVVQVLCEAPEAAIEADEHTSAEEEVGQTKQSTIYDPGEAPWQRDATIRAQAERLVELERLTATWCDHPDDRMWHAEDGTWWRREGNRLVSAEAPVAAGLTWEEKL